jgi:mono/diheme cytochrome c family protein
VTATRKALTLAGLLAALTGCLFEDREGAIAVLPGTFSGVQTCGLKGFAYYVMPKLRANCASCHGGSGPGAGSFAAADVTVAYGAARSRASMRNPGGSLLVARSSESGHGNNCSTCGGPWGELLTTSIAEWAEAESNDPAVCAALPDLAGTVEDFDQGTYNPGSGVEVVIVPDGLAEFSESGGVHDILRTNCFDCHVPARPAGFAPFAQTDPTEAYRAAKPRVNFTDVSLSKLVNRAANDAHCGICGDSGLVSSLLARLADWQAEESAGVALLRVELDSKALGLLAQGNSVTLTWNLGTESTPASSTLAGAQFQVTVERPTGASFQFVYRVKNPTLIASGSRPLEAREIKFVVNGTEQPLVATFTGVNVVVPAGQSSGVLVATPALVSITNAATDELGFAFSILRGQ